MKRRLHRSQRENTQKYVLLLLVFVWVCMALFIKNYVQKLPSIIIQTEWSIDDFFSDNDFLITQTDLVYEKLSDDQRIAQLIMPSIDNESSDASINRLINDNIIGGVIILDKNITKERIDALKKNSDMYLFVAIDAEPSLVKYRLPELVDIPNTNELITKQDIMTYGHKIAEKLHYLGVNINFAPVYDFGVNDTVIGNRAFGRNEADVSTRANVFSQSQLDKNIFPTAKHFPGHGHVTGDTHKDLQTISGKLREINVFKSAIKENIPLMMVGHLAVTDNDRYSTDDLPATLSPKIMKDLLQRELDFRGIIITDAMNMGAVQAIEDRDMKSLRAGSDIILMPENPAKLHADIAKEIVENEVFDSEIEIKVRKVLKFKLLQRLMGVFQK